MNKSVIYIVGATVLIGGGAYLFFKNKKAKDLAKLDELGGAISGGTTAGGTTAGGTTSGGTTPSSSTTSNADINLANATIIASEIRAIDKQYNSPFVGQRYKSGVPSILNETPEYKAHRMMRATYKIRREPKVAELAKLGYKLDAIGQLVKI